MTTTELKQQYEKSKAAKVGATTTCPSCGVAFTKKTRQQAFCSNGKSGAGNCKDAYWNKIDENKRNRKHHPDHYRKYNTGEKSFAAFQSRIESDDPRGEMTDEIDLDF